MVCLTVAVLALASVSLARAGTIDGVIASYVSGNEGTDLTVRTSDGHSHRLWFDNLKKPLFQGKRLPWCPDFPCAGWPSQLVIGKTHVHVTYVRERVEGKTIDSPTRVDLLH